MLNTTSFNSKSINQIEDYYIIFALSAVFAVFSVLISSMILILIWRTKTRLHTVNHLLVCNTCVASIFYCVVINNNYIFLIFIPWDTSDMSCRWRAYFGYMSITGVVYSYVIQAISRFFLSILSTKYRCLGTFRAHYILIVCQWLLVFLLASPAILTKDINFAPNQLCWVPLSSTIHLAYTVLAYYIAPMFSITIIYITIYYRIRQTMKNTTNIISAIRRQKIDLEILRNILVLVSVYLGGGLPFLLFVITSIKQIYFLNLVTLSFTVTVEKSLTIVLDREIRRGMRKLIFSRQTTIIPIDVISLPKRKNPSYSNKIPKPETVQRPFYTTFQM